MRVAIGLLVLVVVGCAPPPFHGRRKENPRLEDDPQNKSARDADDAVLEGSSIDPETPDPGTSGETPKQPDPNATTAVKARWNAIAGFQYSFDVKTPEGEWIGPCLSANIIGSKTSVTYEGVCSSADNRQVPKPAGYRLYFSNNGHWADFVERPGGGAEVVFDLPTTPPANVPVSWNKKTDAADYSLDIVLDGGELIAPCIDAGTLGKSLSHTFEGVCTGLGRRDVAIGSVREFRICWAENNDWLSASCAGVPFNGLGRRASIAN